MTHVVMVGLGAVGVATAGSILQQGLARTMTFFDKNDAKAEGEAWDFSHAASLLPPCEVRPLPFEKLMGGDLCVVSAGVKSRPGESRLALLQRNVEVVNEICGAFERNGYPKTLLVLTNPVDVVTEYFTRKLARRGVVVLGSGTSLDTFRLRQILAFRVGVNPRNVHAWVVGEHGDSSVSLFSSARVGCLPLESFNVEGRPVFTGDVLNEIENEVRSAAGRVIERKGATAHAIGFTAGRLVRAILRDEHILLPVSVRVEEGLCASLPCRLHAEGATPTPGDVMTSQEREAFEKSLAVLRKACAALPAGKP